MVNFLMYLERPKCLIIETKDGESEEDARNQLKKITIILFGLNSKKNYHK